LIGKCGIQDGALSFYTLPVQLSFFLPHWSNSMPHVSKMYTCPTGNTNASYPGMPAHTSTCLHAHTPMYLHMLACACASVLPAQMLAQTNCDKYVHARNKLRQPIQVDSCQNEDAREQRGWCARGTWTIPEAKLNQVKRDLTSRCHEATGWNLFFTSCWGGALHQNTSDNKL